MTAAKKKPGSQGEGPGLMDGDADLVIGAIIPAPTDRAGFIGRDLHVHIPHCRPTERFREWLTGGRNIGNATTATANTDPSVSCRLRAEENTSDPPPFRVRWAAGCEKVFSEQVSSVAPRPQLEAVLDYLRDGDVLVITKLDRLARSVAHLVAIGERLEAKGVALKVLDQAIDTSTPTGRLMFNMFGSIAQFERELMLERQREGIAKAKAEGKYKGRKPTARAKGSEVKRLRLEGIGASAIAKRLNISRASVYRLV